MEIIIGTRIKLKESFSDSSIFVEKGHDFTVLSVREGKVDVISNSIHGLYLSLPESNFCDPESYAKENGIDRISEWQLLSPRISKRFKKLQELGTPKDTLDIAANLIYKLDLDNDSWSIFTNLEASPVQVELFHESTGIEIICSKNK